MNLRIKDKSGVYNGVQQIKLLDRNKKSPGQVKVLVKVKNGSWPFQLGQAPLRITISIGDGALGLCTDTDFTTSECAFSGSGKTVKCKR